MKTGKPLNPYAASFVPLCRRETDDENKADTITVGDGKSSYKTATCEQAVKVESGDTDVASGDSESHVNTIRSFEDSVPENPSDGTDQQTMVEEFEMDLAYLSVTFPCMSEQSLADVYFATDSDLEASIEMLGQLELLNSMDSSDTPDFGNTAKASVKQKMTITGETSGSSGSSDHIS